MNLMSGDKAGKNHAKHVMCGRLNDSQMVGNLIEDEVRE